MVSCQRRRRKPLEQKYFNRTAICRFVVSAETSLSSSGRVTKNRVEIDSSFVPIVVSEMCRELLLLCIFYRRQKKIQVISDKSRDGIGKIDFQTIVHKIQKLVILRSEHENIKTRH